jgi:catechol 2,3-dioxygenase-like lactoylglutathione lyase family enzyme
MAGITFVRTQDLTRITEFYTEWIGMTRWLSQPHIEILRHDNMLVGFQQSDHADTDALLTFFYPTPQGVDELYERFAPVALGAPSENKRYRIYNFFARDPDGRRIEFQCFLHGLRDVPGVPWV